MSSGPLVSVLIPVFNGEKYLLQALQSIQSQTYRNFETVIVNDGSTDRSALIIDQFLLSDSRVRAIHKSRSGLTDSLNVGLEAARGDFIARLDSDDWSDMSRLELQVARVKRDSSLVLLGTDFCTFNEESGKVRHFHLPQGHDELLKRLSRLRGFFPHSSVMFDLNTARKVGGYDAEALYNEDWDLWLKLAEHGKVSSIPRNLVTIREHRGQTTRRANPTVPISEAFVSSVLHHIRIHNTHADFDVQINRKTIREYVQRTPEYQSFLERVRFQITIQTLLFTPHSPLRKIQQLLFMRGILRTVVSLWVYKTRGTDAPRLVARALSRREVV